MHSMSVKLEQRKAKGNYRKLQCVEGLIDFASNDYLGLAKDVGSTGSRLLTGNSPFVEKLEKKIASFHGFKAGTIYSSGYLANLGLLSAMGQEGDTIIFDIESHASTRDGIRLSDAHAFAFRHNDLNHLEARLKNCRGKKNTFICVESIYSTDGSVAPLREILEISQKYGAHLIVDEAHAVGVFGKEGRGRCDQLGITSHLFAQVVTFSKALGLVGAIVLGSDVLKEFLHNFSRPFIYTTALPFEVLSHIERAYDLLPTLNGSREHLLKLAQLLDMSQTPINALKVKGAVRAKEVAAKLAKEGFDVRALTAPTVREGEEVLRIIVHAFNTEAQVLSLKKLCHTLL